MPEAILVVDDDDLFRRSLAFNLERANFQVQTAASAEVALEMIRADPPDLILMDVTLPGIDGLEALRLLRNQIPIILLTGRDRQLDEVLGLELGADDYITKPYDLDVLLARVRTVLRRARQKTPARAQVGPLVVGDLTIDVGAYSVAVIGQPLVLTPREFRILYTLALHAEQVVPTENLIARVWGAEYEGEPQILYVHIHALREKLERDPARPERIVTVRGIGYKLIPQGD
jgi:DNA-binding response OmpR family regulator